MPLTKKGKKIMHSMTAEYGKKEGKKIFYASRNKGKIRGVDRGFFGHYSPKEAAMGGRIRTTANTYC